MAGRLFSLLPANVCFGLYYASIMVWVDSVTGHDIKRVFYCVSYCLFIDNRTKTTWLTAFTKSEVESIYHCTVYMHAYWQTASVTKSVLIGIKRPPLLWFSYIFTFGTDLTYQSVKLDRQLVCRQSPSPKIQLMWQSNRPTWQVSLGLRVISACCYWLENMILIQTDSVWQSLQK